MDEYTLDIIWKVLRIAHGEKDFMWALSCSTGYDVHELVEWVQEAESVVKKYIDAIQDPDVIVGAIAIPAEEDGPVTFEAGPKGGPSKEALRAANASEIREAKIRRAVKRRARLKDDGPLYVKECAFCYPEDGKHRPHCASPANRDVYKKGPQ